MYTFSQFIDSEWNLVVLHGETVVFTSKASDLRPLVHYLGERQSGSEPVTFFDRYVGRAAAKLMVTVNPVRVYTGVISSAGLQTLTEAGIPFEARETVEYLMGVASDGMCRWEKLSMQLTTDELLDELRQEYEG